MRHFGVASIIAMATALVVIYWLHAILTSWPSAGSSTTRLKSEVVCQSAVLHGDKGSLSARPEHQAKDVLNAHVPGGSAAVASVDDCDVAHRLPASRPFP